MALRDRFEGSGGERALREVVCSSKLVRGNAELASALISAGNIEEFDEGTKLIDQGGDDDDLFLIIAGTCDIEINGRRVARRGPSDHVGEMAAIEPSQQRSATVMASSQVVALRLTAPAFHELAHTYPSVYKEIARELARRLLQRNSLVGEFRDRVRIFIVSSVEALPIARAVQSAFEHDPFNVVIWTDGVFKVANYTLQSLEDELDKSDFAIAIAHADDLTSIRGADWPTPRDNVIFELGLFMGRIGRSRAILMEPREEKVKLPSDLAGVTTIAYRYEKGPDLASFIAPACNRLRDHINALGPHNG
tara:strand:- start:3528 stop:4448 length:921 start_codon:yes stop_codon:yes gene_type:complete